MFESKVRVEEDGDYWLLLTPLVYRGAREVFEVPAGTRTDFASVPHWATWLLPRTGKHNRAAVTHDYLVRIAAGVIPSKRDWVSGPDEAFHALPPYVSRKDADGIFLRILRELGVPEWRARLMYAGVRLGSWLRT